jgi:uncharacterized protein YaeQ
LGVTAMATHWVIIASAGKKARMYSLAESRLGGERRARVWWQSATRRRREFMKVGVVSHDDELVAELLMPPAAVREQRVCTAHR